MSILSSMFKAFFKPKSSSTQQLSSMFQEISKNPIISNARNDAKNEYDLDLISWEIKKEYDQIGIIKEKIIDMPAWSDIAPSISDQLGHNLDQYSMADFYSDVGAIIYWTLMSTRQDMPDSDIFDLDVIEPVLEELMKDLAEKTTNFEVINSQYMKNKINGVRSCLEKQA